MRLFLLSLFLGVISLNAFPQSKLQGASKVTKVGTSNTTNSSTTKKPTTQAKRNPGSSTKYESTGYMEIMDISFANTDAVVNIIDNYGSKLYAKEIKYLKPRISYKGLANEDKEITLGIKLYDEDGTLKTGTSSPEGYTYMDDVEVEPGSGKYIYLPGWGNAKGGTYNAGLYKLEVWYKEHMLYQKEIRLYSGTTPITSSNLLSINSISFANTDKDGNIIDDYGKTLYDGKVQYLKPKVYYTGKYSTDQQATLYFRYFKSSGDLVSGSNSPTGFSFKGSVTIKPGANSMTFAGFGNESATNYKEGICKIEVWIDGEKLYETEVTINKLGSSTYNGSGDATMLKALLEKPMGIGNCDPITASYSEVKNSISSYIIKDISGDQATTFRIYANENKDKQNLEYHNLQFHYFYYTILNDASSLLDRRMKYEFTIDKSELSTLNQAYSRLDLIINDFKSLGYEISYTKKDDEYSKAKGGIRFGTLEYELELTENKNSFDFIINVWVWKPKQ